LQSFDADKALPATVRWKSQARSRCRRIC